MKSVLSETHIKVLQFVCELEESESRLKEESDGDVEFFQWGVPDGLSLTERDLVGLLHQFEVGGYIEASNIVHACDSSEYIYKWKATSEGKSVAISNYPRKA